MKFIHGIAFPDADDFMADEMTPDGSYQASHLRMALSFVTDHGLALDGGAHVGLWTRVLSTTFAQVIAVEPSTDTCEALRLNVSTWRCANVEIHQAALGATGGTVSMTLDATEAARRNTGGRYAINGDDVTRLTIDSLALPTLGFLKLDVEGSELAALQGARATLRRCRPVVLYEAKGLGAQHYGESRDACATWLTAIGYAKVARIGCDEIWRPKHR